MQTKNSSINQIHFDGDSMDICFEPMSATDYDIECYRVDGFSAEQVHDIAVAKEFLLKSPNIASVNVWVDVDIINYEDDVMPDNTFFTVSNKGIYTVCITTFMESFQTEMLESRVLLWEDYDKIIKKFKLNRFASKLV